MVHAAAGTVLSIVALDMPVITETAAFLFTSRDSADRLRPYDMQNPVGVDVALT